ncbi:MAG: hypothetical protein U1G05_06010 [Kiritimatiellia bacterium]
MLFNMLVTAIAYLPAAGGPIGIKTKNVKAEPAILRRAGVRASRSPTARPGHHAWHRPACRNCPRWKPAAREEEELGGLYAMVRELDGTIMRSPPDRDAVTKVEVLPLCTEEEFKVLGPSGSLGGGPPAVHLDRRRRSRLRRDVRGDPARGRP